MPACTIYIKDRDVQKEVVIVRGARTAIGKFGGSLKDVPPTELAALVVRRHVQGDVWPPLTAVSLKHRRH